MQNQLWNSFGLLHQYPVFTRFWIAQMFSLLGDAMTYLTLPWFVWQVTGSGTATAAILLCLHLPAIATGMVIGSLLDRFQPRTIIALDNGLRTVIILVVPILYWLGLLELWMLFGLVVLAGLLQPATLVGFRTMLPDLVDDADLDGANMLWSFNTNLSVVIGPAIAGVLIAAFGGPVVLLIDALTFGFMAIIALTLPRMDRSELPEAQPQTPWAERLGLRQLWDLKVVRLTTVLSLCFFFSYGPLEAAMPPYTSDVLGSGARGYGLLWTSLGVGALLGTLTSTLWSSRLRLGVALPLIALLWGASLLPVAFTNQLWIACAFLALGGWFWGPYLPMETTLLQRTVPKAQRGRIFGARSTLMTSGAPLGLALGGVLLAFIPPTAIIALSGLACVSVGVAGLASSTLRELVLPGVPQVESVGDD